MVMIVTACQQACPTSAIVVRQHQRQEQQGRQSRRLKERDYPVPLRPELPSTHDVHSWRHQPESGAGINGYERDPIVDPDDRPGAPASTQSLRRAITSSQSRRRSRGIVLTSNTPLGWFFGLIVGAAASPARRDHRHHLALSQGRRHLGRYDSRCAWGFAIINFVWWIGIGHAGTLISAILLLFKQTWRNSDQPVRRSDDHLRGRLRRNLPTHSRRPPMAGVLAVPVPEHDERLATVPQSPLAWDVFAVSTYATHLDPLLVRRHDSGLRHPPR